MSLLSEEVFYMGMYLSLKMGAPAYDHAYQTTSLDQIRQTAGPRLFDMLEVYFPTYQTDSSLVDWFHQRREIFGARSPHEMCEQGDSKTLYSHLVVLAQGNLG